MAFSYKEEVEKCFPFSSEELLNIFVGEIKYPS